MQTPIQQPQNKPLRRSGPVGAVCVVRYDNEIGKGDHRHFGAAENPYRFTTPERLTVDFQKDIARWNDENSHS